MKTKKPKRLRDRRRYDAFLRMCEVAPDLSFKEWLTSHIYEESRASCG